MKANKIVLTAVLALTSGAALAFHCPKDMKQIDAALEQGTDLSAAQLEQVKALRAKGEELHKAGKHQESVDTLARAKQMLGIQ